MQQQLTAAGGLRWSATSFGGSCSMRGWGGTGSEEGPIAEDDDG
jgi:hypothetical protein